MQIVPKVLKRTVNQQPLDVGMSICIRDAHSSNMTLEGSRCTRCRDEADDRIALFCDKERMSFRHVSILDTTQLRFDDVIMSIPTLVENVLELAYGVRSFTVDPLQTFNSDRRVTFVALVRTMIRPFKKHT